MPTLKAIDHFHVYVTNRTDAEAWYAEVLGLHRAKDLEFWAVGKGPLTLTNETGTVHLALFEKAHDDFRATLAFSASASEFVNWIGHLSRFYPEPVTAVDHQVSWSLYFKDPDGNPYEVTTYDYAEAAELMH